MKTTSKIVLFAVAAGAGFGLVWQSRSSDAAAGRKSAVVAAAGSADQAPLSPMDALRREIASGRPISGPEVEGRMRQGLLLSGMDKAEAEEWARALSADNTAGFPALWDKLKDKNYNDLSLPYLMFMDRWAQLDPTGGAAWFKQVAAAKPGDKDADNGLAYFMRQWGLADFDAASAAAIAYGDKTRRRTLREKAKQDPVEFIAWAKMHPDHNPFDIFQTGAIGIDPVNNDAIAAIADVDLDQALAWAKSAKTDKWKAGLAITLAEKLAKRNPEEALAWAKDLGKAGAQAVLSVAKVVADTDPDKALAILKDLDTGSSYQAQQGMRDVVAKLVAKDMSKALAALEQLPKGKTRDQMAGTVLSKLLSDQPEKAFDMARRLELKTNYLESPEVPNAPAAKKLLDAALKGGESQFQQMVVANTYYNWSTLDPAGLAEYIKSKPGDPNLERMREQMKAQMDWQPLNPALTEALQIPKEDMIRSQATQDPEGAVETFAQISDPAARAKAAGNLAERWGARDRSDAVDWAATLTNPEEQAAAYGKLAGQWVGEDSHDASEWISGLAAGKPRDAAVGAMMSGISKHEPDSAWQWGLTVADPEIRAEGLRRVARAWNRADPAAAQAAFANPGLSEADQAAITQGLTNQDPANNNNNNRQP